MAGLQPASETPKGARMAKAPIGKRGPQGARSGSSVSGLPRLAYRGTITGSHPGVIEGAFSVTGFIRAVPFASPALPPRPLKPTARDGNTCLQSVLTLKQHFNIRAV